MPLSVDKTKRAGVALLASGAIFAIVPLMLLPLDFRSAIDRQFYLALFPATSGVAFASTFVALLLLRKTHLRTELTATMLVVLGANLGFSAFFLIPGILGAGCIEGSTSPRPCGVGPSLCGVNFFMGIVALILALAAIREVRLSASPPPVEIGRP